MKYDSTHGRFKHKVEIGAADELIVNGHKIKCIQASRDGPKALPWGEMGVDYDKSAHNIVSNASCTTNCLAPLCHVIMKEGIG